MADVDVGQPSVYVARTSPRTVHHFLKTLLVQVVTRMERERCDLPEYLGRDAPERRSAAGRAATGIVLRREHRGELVEVVPFVVRPAASVDHSFDIQVGKPRRELVRVSGEIGAGTQENRPDAEATRVTLVCRLAAE